MAAAVPPRQLETNAMATPIHSVKPASPASNLPPLSRDQVIVRTNPLAANNSKPSGVLALRMAASVSSQKQRVDWGEACTFPVLVLGHLRRVRTKLDLDRHVAKAPQASEPAFVSRRRQRVI